MSVLTKELIIRLIRKKNPIVSPILDEAQIDEGSINVRLGTKFIITKRPEYGVIDPSKLSHSEIRKFQTKIHRDFGQTLYLHPRQLVLASTFEFINLPKDLSGYVLSRSSYGRIGLMVATATYIHPLWKGCLTLELLNYGDAPIVLRCGEPIAQLIIQKASLSPERIPRTSPIHIPLEPEFVSMEGRGDWKKFNYFHPEDDKLKLEVQKLKEEIQKAAEKEVTITSLNEALEKQVEDLKAQMTKRKR